MFEHFNYTKEQVNKYFQAAVKDLRLAASAGAPELVFYVCYNIIVKVAMAVCAKNNIRVKSRMGHHAELIAKLASYLGDEEIVLIAGKMRTKRNRDLYDGGTITSQKEADSYIQFCRKLVKNADDYIFPDKLL